MIYLEQMLGDSADKHEMHASSDVQGFHQRPTRSRTVLPSVPDAITYSASISASIASISAIKCH